jgi:hypothetical protein
MVPVWGDFPVTLREELSEKGGELGIGSSHSSRAWLAGG